MHRALAATILFCGACPDRQIARVEPSADRVEKKDIDLELTGVDLLFVIDDSGSMAEEQASLRANFPRFIGKLSALPNGLPDVHVGIVSTDVGTGTTVVPTCTPLGDDVRLVTRDCAGVDPTARYLSDIAVDGVRVRNYSGELAAVFSCMADLGTRGCGAEQPLESLRLALDPARGANPGFLRPGTLLAVVIISDEDDCSAKDRAIFTRGGSLDSVLFGCTEFGITCAEPDLRAFGVKHDCAPQDDSPYLRAVDDYVAFLRGLRPDQDRLVVGAITGQDTCVAVGPGPNDRTAPALQTLHACDGAIAGAAYPSVRTSAFRESFEHSTFVPIGDGDLTGALDQVASTIAGAVGNWCIEGTLADRNPAPGLQPECTVSDVQHPGTPQQTGEVLPACDAGHTKTPCWTIRDAPLECAKWPSHLILAIDRGGLVPPPSDHVRAQCVTQ